MPKRACCYLCLVLCCVSLHLETVSAEETKQKPAADQKTNAQTYEAILYELGAFPVSRLAKGYWDNGHPGQFYKKGKREDVAGWIRPFWTRADRYDLPKKPLSYERYVSLMDVETYQKTKDPLLFAIIQFTLEEFLYRDLEIKNPEDFLKVYHAKMGLDHQVLVLLKRRGLTAQEVTHLYERQKVPLLLRCLPPPEKGQDGYILFLEQISSGRTLQAGYRFEAYKLLYEWDQEKYLTGYKEFLIKHTEQTPDVLDRCFMNEALLKLGDEDCFTVVRRSLVTDPIYVLAEEKAKECRRVWHFGNGPGMDVGETEMYHLLKGLLFVSNKQDLSEETVQKIQHTRATLEAKKQERRGSGD